VTAPAPRRPTPAATRTPETVYESLEDTLMRLHHLPIARTAAERQHYVTELQKVTDLWWELGTMVQPYAPKWALGAVMRCISSSSLEVDQFREKWKIR